MESILFVFFALHLCCASHFLQLKHNTVHPLSIFRHAHPYQQHFPRKMIPPTLPSDPTSRLCRAYVRVRQNRRADEQFQAIEQTIQDLLPHVAEHQKAFARQRRELASQREELAGLQASIHRIHLAQRDPHTPGSKQTVPKPIRRLPPNVPTGVPNAIHKTRSALQDIRRNSA